MSLVGLELGSRLGTQFGQRGEVLGGALLMGVGIAIASGVV
jgi:putative Mn2+ efflux pump MntP